MNRWVGGVTIAVAGLLALLAWNRQAAGAAADPLPQVASPARPPSPQAGPAPDSRAEESVRVEYELVQARLVASPARARVALASQTRRAEARRDSRRLVVRASRMIVGDGRYRPEPFPRPASR